MRPLPWSHTAREDFINCPRAYHEKRVLKSVKETETEQMIWGTWVHKQFENRQNACPLPDTLAEHEKFMSELDRQPGEHFTERKVALDRTVKPCEFFGKAVWWRGVIDWHSISYQFARVVDYKTGKPHTKYGQLKENALWIFSAYPEVKEAHVSFYWTKTQTSTAQTYRREQAPELWSEIAPDLTQYAEAFKTDTWQPRQSGLCNGWCPVTGCEFWKPKRNK